MFEVLLRVVLVSYVVVRINNTNLEVECEIVHLAAIFVVFLGVAPDETDFFLKGIPCLEVGNVGRRRTAVNAFRTFRNALQGYGMTNDLVVVLEFACG